MGPSSPRRTWRWHAGILLGPVRELLLRRATARWRALPNVFLIGAVKAGTTSMAAYLERHPAYLPAYTKELMYLQDLPGLAGNEAIHGVLGTVWGKYNPDHPLGYRKFFPLISEMRKTAKEMRSPVATGDHTPFYLYCPVALRRIREITPKARVIVLLREPVARAYADYTMHRARNPLETRSFEQAIDDELAGRPAPVGGEGFRTRYLYKSTYAPHVRRCQEIFPRDRLLILRSDDFFHRDRTADVMRRVFRFLDLEAVAMEEFPIHNQGTYDHPMQPELRKKLQNHFRPHNEELAALLGGDFQWRAWPEPIVGYDEDGVRDG